MPEWEPAAESFGPSVTHGWATQLRWERSAAMVRRTLGKYSSLSPSPAHLSHTRNITLSRRKSERLYFYKDVYSFVHSSSSLLLTMFPLISVLCIWLYNLFIPNYQLIYYDLEYPNYCLHLYCYIQNVSVDVSFGLPQVYHVELESPLFNPRG